MPLRVLSEGKGRTVTGKPLVDIIAVHGLNPKGNSDEFHARETWSKPKGGKGELWLKDKLPSTLPNARIFMAFYDSNPAFASKERFFRQATSLLEEIFMCRDDIEDPNRPIVFIAHSLGGILVKQALVNAHNNPRYGAIKEAVHGLVFFGVPHAGGDRASIILGGLAAKIAGVVHPGANKDIMETLKDGSMYTDILRDMFRHQLEQYQIVSFYERLPKFGQVIVVPYESATLGLAGHRENQVGLNANHSDMCAFDTSEQHDVDLYELVEFNVKIVCRDAIKERSKGPHGFIRTNTFDQHLEESYKFALAVEDCTSRNGSLLEFKRGTLIEGIKVYTRKTEKNRKVDETGKTEKTRETETVLEGRIRGTCGRIPTDSVVLIEHKRHGKQEKILAACSTQLLFDKAKEKGDELVERLFAKRPENSSQPQLSATATNLTTTYIDLNGKVHNDALHTAVIAEDYDMIQFLIERGVDVNKRAAFQAMFSKHPRDDPKNWEPYVSVLPGTPLTAAVNRYARSKHLRDGTRDQEVKIWRKMIRKLLDHKASWSKFADCGELIGPHSALRADAPSVLWRAIDYDDREIYGLVLEAEPPLKFEWLPWRPFFEPAEWQLSAKPSALPLRGIETEPLISMLRANMFLAEPNMEEPLKMSIERVIWQQFPELRLPSSRINDLFDDFMDQLTISPETESNTGFETALGQLKSILGCNPDLRSWAEKNSQPSVLHFCVDRSLHGPLAAFLEHGSAKTDINLSFEDGKNLLDKASSNDMKALLEDHGGRQSLRRISVSAIPKSISPTSGSGILVVLQAKLSRIEVPTLQKALSSTQAGQTRRESSLPRYRRAMGSGLHPEAARSAGGSPVSRPRSRASQDSRQAEIDSQELQYAHYSDPESQLGHSTVTSRPPSEEAETDRTRSAAASTTSTEVPAVPTLDYAGALRNDLNPHQVFLSPSLTIPSLRGRESRTGPPAAPPSGRAGSSLSRGHGEGRGRGRGSGTSR